MGTNGTIQIVYNFYFKQISKTRDKHENKFPKNLTLINGPIIRSNDEKTVAHS